MEREAAIERLDVLERVVSQLFSEIVMLRSAVKSFQPVDETDEDGELNEEELRELVKSGQITGFIGVMKNFE